MSTQQQQAAKSAVAITIYNEARSDGKEGMKAVAEVIYNRIGHAAYGSKQSALAVVSAPNQFLGYKTTEPNPTNQKEIDLWKYALELADTLVVSGKSPGNSTGGAHAFHQSSKSDGLVGTAWKAEHTATIGKHYFFKISKKLNKELIFK
ncbi:hypothetical protein ABK040_001895 [Willaertia magna]